MTREKQEKEPIYISNRVLENFKRELAVFGGDLNKLMHGYRAMKKRDDIDHVCRYEGDDVSKYQKFLENAGLADIDLFFDFSLPRNYFILLMSRIK